MPRFDDSRGTRWLGRVAVQARRYARLMRLDQPIGIWLLLWPTLWALWLASDGQPSEHIFAVFVLGTIILRSAGCVINDFADRDIDPYVERTAGRPLATGEVAPFEALLLFLGLMLIALGLVMTLNRLTVQLAVVGAVLTVVYPFMKRLIVAPQLVLGLAFAWGVPMAYAAVGGTIASRTLWLLYVCTIVWVVIYDTEYAMVDRDDDLEVGVRSTAIFFGEMDVAVVAGLELVLLAGLGLLGHDAGLGRWFWIGLTAAAGFALRQYLLIRGREPAACLTAFRNNAWFGGAIFAGMLLDYVFRMA
jgi:4-hydroxybenzoate polyprenyltransferase